MASLHEVLSTTITTRVVTREAGVNRYLLNLFGMQPGGPAENPVGHRQFGFDIFNDTRKVLQGRAPGTSAAQTPRQAVGRVQGVFPRFADSLHLLSEEIHNLRAIGGPSSVFDERGVRYVTRQQKYMGQKLGNMRSLLLAGMLRGKIYAHKSGDDIYYDFSSSSAAFQIDWQMPSGNMTNFGGVIDKAWSDPTADIPGHLRAINAAQQAVVGTSLEVIITTASMWGYVCNNDNVQAQAGTSNPPFTYQERVVGTDAGTGLPQTVIIGRIAAIPWITWIITDEGVKIGAPGSEAFTKFIPDNSLWFGPRPTPELFEMLLGSEPVSEGYGQQETVRMGAYAYTKVVDNPTGRLLFAGDNCVPANYVPNCNGLLTPVF